MKQSLEVLRQVFVAFLRRLADDPLLLICLLLAANAVVQPYIGFDHDARLYAIQIENRLQPGSFADDLYLRYGSQDRYTLFSALAIPVVRLLGLTAAFFVLYLASKALFFWAALRLSRTLLGSGPALVLALLHLAVVPVAFGGNEIFHANESFLTPRIAASALVLLGLERMLANRPSVALSLMAGSFLLHPLMALGGLVTLLLWSLLTRCTVRQLVALGLAAVAAAIVSLGYEPLGTRVFGHMDDTWRRINFEVCYFIQPSEWTWGDWLRIGLAALLALGAACTFARRFASFLGAVLGAAVLGLVGSVVAVHSHYLLLIQVSPYRTLWVMEFLAIPLTYGAAAALWRRGSPSARAAALVVVLLTGCDWNRDFVPGPVLFLVLLPLSLVAFRGLAAVPRRSDWLTWTALAAFAVSVFLMTVFNLTCTIFLLYYPKSPQMDLHPVQVLMMAPGVLYKLPMLGLVLYLAARSLPATASRRRLCVTCLAVWIGCQTLVLWAPHSAWYGERLSFTYRQTRFVASVLVARGGDRKPTVYWPARLQESWFDVGVRSFYHHCQLSGCAFNRGTAIEGRRRADRVRLFEIAALRGVHLEPWWQRALNRFYPIHGNDPLPSEADLFQLCDEPGLDFVVLPIRFEGLSCADNGYCFVYDCRQVRAIAHRNRAAGSAQAPQTPNTPAG